MQTNEGSTIGKRARLPYAYAHKLASEALTPDVSGVVSEYDIMAVLVISTLSLPTMQTCDGNYKTQEAEVKRVFLGYHEDLLEYFRQGRGGCGQVVTQFRVRRDYIPACLQLYDWCHGVTPLRVVLACDVGIALHPGWDVWQRLPRDNKVDSLRHYLADVPWQVDMLLQRLLECATDTSCTAEKMFACYFESRMLAEAGQLGRRAAALSADFRAKWEQQPKE